MRPVYFKEWIIMSDETGKLLGGDAEWLKASQEALQAQPVDLDVTDPNPPPPHPARRTIAEPAELKGPGTFFGKAIRTLRFEPSERDGWWMDRSDFPNYLPTRVSVRNVWTTGDVVSNIVLRSGPPSNYVRMVEHIIALRLGLAVDDLTVRLDSGDPPLFDRGSLDLIDALEQATLVDTDRPARLVTVKEPVSIVHAGGGFLKIEPASPDRPALDLDCAIDFKTAIGRQRLKLTLNEALFRRGAEARTNTSAAKKIYCKTIGLLFADIRNLGYTRENILIAAKHRYINEPRLFHEGTSLEAVWHRAVLDLLAALALIDSGRFMGKVTSYKAGHTLDVEMVTQLYLHDLLTPLA